MIEESRNDVELAVVGWSAWAPGLKTLTDWKMWAAGEHDISPFPQMPDVDFVPAMLRRRLSALSRMVFHVAKTCLESGEPPDAYVYCSRYGDYQRSFEILSGLARQEPVSPAAFSQSVHNTSASQFSINQGDPAPYAALAAEAATLESSFLDAWTLLTNQEAIRVMLIYHDEPLPPLYKEQDTNVTQKFALALVLQTCETNLNADRLQLSWTGSSSNDTTAQGSNDPALEVLRLMINGGTPITNDTGRLAWRWAKHARTA